VDVLKALAALALTVVLLTGCGGGGDDATKVEASLGHYLSTLDPEACLDAGFCGQSAFPVGAGVPQVREHSCRKTHTGPLRRKGLSGWSCVITFAHGKSALPVAVAVRGNGEVSAAAPMGPPLPPATVYEGGS
jgi:hypothetical protein